VEKLYVHEIGPDGQVSTVGLFYSRAEAENVVAQLRTIPGKSSCRYEITETIFTTADSELKWPKKSSRREESARG
jgi:hypothetical protein